MFAKRDISDNFLSQMSKAHNPIQDIYLRRAEKGDNKVIGVAWKALEDPARGCKLG